MIKKNPLTTFKKAKTFILVFFCLAGLACKDDAKQEIKVLYKKEKAVSVSFYLENAQETDIAVFVKGNTENKVLGYIGKHENNYTFTPVIPFSVGQEYELKYKNETLGIFAAKKQKSSKQPSLIALYPSIDTLPENVLKMYFVFSEPMSEVGNSINFIKVIHKESGLEKDVFLELQPELWNKEHTILTLWLDPGRIKKGLIPNLEKGPPLVANNSYALNIDTSWKSASGNTLDKGYTKTFYVNKADVYKPKVYQWKLTLPQEQTKEHLTIHLGETLDAILLQETIQVFDENNKLVQGNFIHKNAETVLEFYPEQQWNRGEHTLKIEPRLEDVAGNNLLHLFDTDIKENASNAASIQQVLFKIK